MTKLPVTELVCEDSDDLFRLALLNQSVVDDNVLLPGETKEIGVRVGAALAAIDNVELVQGELQASSKAFDLILKLALLKRGELVEEWQNQNRVDSNHEDLQTSSEDPEVEEELVARLLDDLEETGHDGRNEREGKELRLEKIRDEELRRLLVEPKLLLQDKRLVNRSRQPENLTDDKEAQDEDNRMADFAGEPRRRPLEQQVAGPAPQLRKHIEVNECNVLDLRPQAIDDLELGFRATICLRLVENFLGDFLGEHSGGSCLLEDTVLAKREEGFEEVLADGEADDELLPGEERAVEEAR